MKVFETGTKASSEPRELRHPGSRALFRYWESIRGERSVAERADLDLKKIRSLVPWLCILERNPVRQAYRWRLAGTGVCRIWGQELTGGELLDGWQPEDRANLASVFDRVVGLLQPCVTRLKAVSMDDEAVEVEMLGLPIRASTGSTVQILGSVLPFQESSWLGQVPLASLTLTSVKVIWTEPVPEIRSGASSPLHPSILAGPVGLPSHRRREILTFDSSFLRLTSHLQRWRQSDLAAELREGNWT